MMPPFLRVTKIATNRQYESWPSWHIVHEWEDIFSRALNIPLSHLSQKSIPEKMIGRTVCHFPYQYLCGAMESFRRYDSYSLLFHLTPANFVRRDQIPIIIDFWKHHDLNKFYAAYRDCPVVFISSMEVFQFLKDTRCPLNIHHLALSLPDTIKPDKFPQKEFDIIYPGRSSKIFCDYMATLLREEPSIEYVSRKIINGEMRYFSNKRGDLGDFQSRDEYLKLLRQCRVALYTSPGIGRGKERTGGFNPVTPRLLEDVACNCLVAGHYKDNVDFQYYGIADICPNISNYQQFKTLITSYLKQGQSHSHYSRYPDFMERHLTSERAHQLMEIIRQLGS